ncbi:glycoside hydrolase family 20 protein [Paxillus rubicundulus Ve08.2h10]|uniref:Beta-hexosaminidase n=1 Tax=Paxillus rubicundulus Ve08.2h10 TaxID=930991 RepID=A0A0D0ECR7_9AGAM|nr:glycoside hydrolase family 20 protein [Paxillus rubicundulus Ve08.2h10]
MGHPKFTTWFAALLVACTPAAALWPLPQSLTTGSDLVVLATNFNIKLSMDNSPKDLQDAVSRTEHYLSHDNLGRLLVGRGSSDAAAIKTAKQLSILIVSCGVDTPRSLSDEAMDDLESRDEKYILSVPSDGTPATLRANSTLGLFRGLTTFSQLFYEYDRVIYAPETPIEIEDWPTYPYRGFMLDTARNYYPVSDIKRTLDAMSWVKINAFHWHVVDSQSFPIEVPGFMELSQQGAYGPNLVYTTSDVRDIVSYAAERGIDVVVEIDTPGHTAAIGESHPEHVVCFHATPWVNWANEPPAGQLRFANESTVFFTTSLLSAVAKMFPSKLFSTGGDEVHTNCYNADAQTQEILNSTGQTLEQSLSSFTQSTHGALEKLGKTPVVWEGRSCFLDFQCISSTETLSEMVLEHNVTLSNNTVVMVWISSQNVEAVAQKGFRVIHAASDYFYLDCGAGEWIGNDPFANSWCDPFKTWQKSYTFDPLANLTEAESKLILGGQHMLWSEQSSPHNLDSITWPRAAASAELFWSGPAGTETTANGRNVDTALPRLHDIAFRMTNRGVAAIALQPLWCALRPGVCDLTA